MNAHTYSQDFQAIAHDVNNDKVDLYSKLDYSDLIKLIIATQPNNLQVEADFIFLGWREEIHNDQFRWKKDWISKLKDAQLLPAFYVYIKTLTNT